MTTSPSSIKSNGPPARLAATHALSYTFSATTRMSTAVVLLLCEYHYSYIVLNMATTAVPVYSNGWHVTRQHPPTKKRTRNPLTYPPTQLLFASMKLLRQCMTACLTTSSQIAIPALGLPCEQYSSIQNPFYGEQE